jgi:crotonobetainyl-CoA:carnitine CoA-transferase CaiB-like acyl-CoA transferase
VSETAAAAAPLAGIRVVELGDGIGSRFCARLLRQLGADVLKFVTAAPQPATGAAALRTNAEELFLDSGKTVRTAPADGLYSSELASAVRECDIVVYGVNCSDGRTERPRAAFDACKELNPSVIFVAASPFGASPAFADWQGGDLEAQAVTGWPNFVGMPEEAPLISNYGGGGLQQGLSCAGAALVALYARGDQAPAEFADVSEADVVAACIRLYSHTYRLYSIPLRRAGMRAPGSSGRYPHAAFRCQDGVVSIICRTTEEWERFVAMIGAPDWTRLPRYQDFYAMATEYPDEVDDLLQPWLMSHTKAELSALAVEYLVPLAPVRTVAEAVDDEQMAFREFFTRAEADGHEARLPGYPVRWG